MFDSPKRRNNVGLRAEIKIENSPVIKVERDLRSSDKKK